MRHVLTLVPLLWCLGNCVEKTPDAPPTVYLGESVCAHCNMIISDERFACATVVRAARGSEARLFDDFNCQRQFEQDHPNETILARWGHDYESGAWLHPEQGWFVHSETLVTPMGSQTALFADEESARRFAERQDGTVLSFRDVWQIR